ncbi:hypothetical protein ACHAXT_012683 [Thalassiosira profunda]
MADLILNLSPENLLHIASYVTRYDVTRLQRQEPVPLLDSDTDSDEAGSYADIDEESEDDVDRMDRMYENDEMDGMDFDDYYERRYDRQGERVMRAQQSEECRTERARQARERAAAAKREARGVVAMMGVCRAWREKMCLPRSCANAVLWKQVFERTFPKVGCQSVVAKGYFNMFQLMVRVEALRGEGKAQAQVAEGSMKGIRVAMDGKVDECAIQVESSRCLTFVEDVVFIMDFQYKKRIYSGIGVMDNEQIIRLCVPKQVMTRTCAKMIAASWSGRRALKPD